MLILYKDDIFKIFLSFQLTKESRHALQAGEHINKPTLAQEYALLDKSATASENYLKNRLKKLEATLAEIRAAEAVKDAENEKLRQEIAELEIKLGMISHKKSQITIFGHKHKIKNFIKKFDIFHEKITTATDFGLYLE